MNWRSLVTSLVTSFLLVCSFSLQAEVTSAIQQRFDQAKTLGDAGQTQEAINIYLELVRAEPQVPEIYHNLAALYLKQKQVDKAKATLEQGLHAHQGYGALYDRLREINVSLARDAYSDALQLDIKKDELSIPLLSLAATEKQAPIAETSSQKSSEVTEASPVQNKVISQDTKQTTRMESVKAVNDKPATTAEVVKAQPVIPATVNRNEALKTVIEAWSTAWSAQAVDIYLSFYHEQYNPDNGMSLTQWQQSRRARLKKPRWIKIYLTDFAVERNNGRQAIVRFKQTYQSDTYQDQTRKRMVLLYTNAGWRIFREKTI